MKKIEVIVRRADLRRFYQCAESLGIFGFDLSEDLISMPAGSHNRRHPGSIVNAEVPSRLTVDFAVLDKEAKDTVHAVLEQVRPDGIAIFKLDQESPPAAGTP